MVRFKETPQGSFLPFLEQEMHCRVEKMLSLKIFNGLRFNPDIFVVLLTNINLKLQSAGCRVLVLSINMCTCC